MDNCSKTCATCRFFDNKCVKYPVNVNESCQACNDYAEAVKMQESAPTRMQLCD